MHLKRKGTKKLNAGQKKKMRKKGSREENKNKGRGAGLEYLLPSIEQYNFFQE